MNFLIISVGLALLSLGGELLVRGASKLASIFGVPSLIVGLTIVAFGTSSPEMAVSVKSALNGNVDIALGNVVGSNIFNVLFILGVSALIAPLSVAPQIIRFDTPIMIAVSILLAFLSTNGNISKLEGIFLFSLIIIYTFSLIWIARNSRSVVVEGIGTPKTLDLKSIFINLGFALVGLVLLVKGADLLVDGAVAIARAWGVSELIIGLTIVSAGTSLPEVAASIAAAIKGERDIAVGNVVGSNIFNILSVLGVTGIVSDAGLPVSAAASNFDIPVMIAVALVCFPLFYFGKSVGRLKGIFFLLSYVGYLYYLINFSSIS